MASTFAWRDRSSWPEKWPRFHTWEPNDPRLMAYAEMLLGTYSGLSCYHGARPEHIESYYERGLIVADEREQVEQARMLFCGRLGIAAKRFDEAVGAVGQRDAGNLFVALDDRIYIDGAGHYLIYGSEYLLSLAAQWPDECMRCRQHLQTRGVPTIFEIAVPLEWLSQRELCELAWCIGREHHRKRPPKLDFTAVLHHSVPPWSIHRHYHPQAIRDWHNGGALYKWSPGTR